MLVYISRINNETFIEEYNNQFNNIYGIKRPKKIDYNILEDDIVEKLYHPFKRGIMIKVLNNDNNTMINYKIDTEHDVCKILTLFENVNRAIDIKLDDLNNKIGENISGKFDVIDVKLNSIYFENEIIKHQLLLEDEIRKSIEEIGNINTCIDETVAKINKILNLK
jgi:hypothetical protein